MIIKRFIASALTATMLLVAAVPAFAQDTGTTTPPAQNTGTTTPPTPPAPPPAPPAQPDLTAQYVVCVKAAITKRGGALGEAFTVRFTKGKAALEAWTIALVKAWDATNKEERELLLAKAKATFHSDTEFAQREYKIATEKARDTFKAEVKACNEKFKIDSRVQTQGLPPQADRGRGKKVRAHGNPVKKFKVPFGLLEEGKKKGFDDDDDDVDLD